MPDDRRRPSNPEPEAPPTEHEKEEARNLRAALEDPALASDDGDFARALSAAWSPKDLSAAEHRMTVERALGRRDATGRRARVIRVAFGVTAVAGLAACVLLLLRSAQTLPTSKPATATLAICRSTQPLFVERFAPIGGETARIDRIAMARAADLRDNQFVRWGVR